MSITAYLEKYKGLGEHFNPEYERENEVLNACKRQFPSIGMEDALSLKTVLE